MTKEDWVRLLLHLPWGILGVAIYSFDKPLGILCCLGTLVYEAFNDWRKKDASYKDVLGIVWGFFLGGILLWLKSLLLS